MSVLPYALPLGALALGWPLIRQRIALSRAKHRSLAGHSRMAKRLARRREAAFETLATGYARRYARTLALTRQAREGLADLQLTGAYRVPFQFAPLVRRQLPVGAFVATAQGHSLTDLDGNPFIDLTGSYGVNVMGVDFYKECMAEGLRMAESVGPVLGAYHPCWPATWRACRPFRDSMRCRSTCPAPRP